MRGGARIGAGQPKKNTETAVLSFRVLKANQIRIKNNYKMIKQALQKPLTFNELLIELKHSHTKDSLEIELNFLCNIGKVGFEKGKFYYIK